MDIVWDAETRSKIDLTVAGAWRYAAHPSTEVLCIAWAVDGEEPRIWVPGVDPVPAEEFAAADRVIAHNYLFERALATHILEPRFGFPCIPIERQYCTMSAALACALPAELNALATALGLPFGKDPEGYRLMRQMSRPRRAKKGQDPNKSYWVDDPEKRSQLHAYAMRDVLVERAAFRQLPLLSPDEQRVWQHDAIVNARGFPVDLALTTAARRIAQSEIAAINAELAQHTEDEITSVHQVQRIIEFVRRHGHTLAALTRRSVAAVLAQDPEETVRRVLELRREGARASVNKLDHLLASIDTDGRQRGTLRYHGGATGRWSGRGFQPQNLKKSESNDIDNAVDAIIAGDLVRIRELGAPLTIVGDCSRSMICAAAGHRLMGGDFSAIESRVLAWVAGEGWKLDNYREYDTTVEKGRPRPELEPYCVTGSRMLGRTVTPDDAVGRALGKTADLALGYGGSLGAWRRFNPTDDRPDGAILLNIQDWRRAHPAICRFWRAYERGCLRAILTGERVQFGTRFAFSFENGTLFAQLPSGRRIAYPKARIGPGKYEGVRQIYFHDNARGGWKEERAWFGTLVENCVQGTARDLLAVAILRLEASKYPVVLHVHDEAVCELAEGIGSEEEFSRLLTTLPDWAEGLPIAANVWAGPRYAKTTTKPAPPTVLDEPPQAVNGAPVPAELPAIAAAPEPEDMEEDVAADAIAEISLADLIGEPLTDGKILCPFHEDHTPSLHIYPNRYYCFVCGASGGHTDWLIKVERQTYPEAVQTLKAWDGPRGYIAADQGKERKERARAFALELWEQAQPIAGTLAAHYLEAVRGIDLTTLPADIDGALRFHPRCSFGSSFHPCLVALMRHPVSDAPLGIHRTALTSEGRKLERKMLGGAGVVKMWPAGAQLVIGEGLETVLAAATRIPYEDAPLRPAWATLSALGLAQFPLLNSVKRLIILIDHDEEGECAAYACTERWRRCGRAVVQLKPDEPGTDFNDLILPE